VIAGRCPRRDAPAARVLDAYSSTVSFALVKKHSPGR
jgi:hypothetical protein